MRTLPGKLWLFFIFCCCGVLVGCGDASFETSTTSGGSAAVLDTPASETITLGRLETPSRRASEGEALRATWDERTIVFDVHDSFGLVSDATVAVKVRIPESDSDDFENESDGDNRSVILAEFDAESGVFVAQLPAEARIPRRGVKVKVVSEDYKTANGRVLMSADGPTYVGVFLRQKRTRGQSSLTGEELAGLTVDPVEATLQPGDTLRLQVSGTLSNGASVVDPPVGVSISPAGATVDIDPEAGTYVFNAAGPGTFSVTFSAGPVTAQATVTVAAPLTGYRTGTVSAWAFNPAGFLDHIDPIDNGFYDGGWNVAFATVENNTTGFGQGVVIGSVPEFHIYLSDGIWATTYLQAAGGSPGALAANHGNGVTATASGEFGQQVLALRFNVDFSNPPDGSQVPDGYYLPAGFGSLRLKGTGTSLDGASVAQVLEQANVALGGGSLPEGYTYATLNDLLTSLNSSFEGGTATPWANAHLEPPALEGLRTGVLSDWAFNPAGFLDHLDPIDNGFYDGGWNVAFATVESNTPGFGQGVVIGLADQFYIYLSDGIWATTYLQGSGGPSGPLDGIYGNGVTATSSGDLGQQVLVLRFNVDFSDPPAGSAVPSGYYLPSGFGQLSLKATQTSLDGATVTEVLAVADQALGGGTLPADYTYASLAELLGQLNGAFLQGEPSAWALAHLED